MTTGTATAAALVLGCTHRLPRYAYLLPGQDLNTLKKDFKNIRDKFDGRYVRLYGSCTQNGY